MSEYLGNRYKPLQRQKCDEGKKGRAEEQKNQERMIKHCAQEELYPTLESTDTA